MAEKRHYAKRICTSCGGAALTDAETRLLVALQAGANDWRDYYEVSALTGVHIRTLSRVISSSPQLFEIQPSAGGQDRATLRLSARGRAIATMAAGPLETHDGIES